jgi:catechol 2,3-dioxygenase-like lactoylglutathione lyase family enzyme
MFQRIDYVSVPVEDFPASVRFYGEVLGLRLRFELPHRWAAFDVGGIEVALYPREPNEGRGGDLAFAVKDLAGAMKRLAAAGVAFPHGVEAFDLPSGRGRLARFRDPSGNRLELVEHERVPRGKGKPRASPP